MLRSDPFAPVPQRPARRELLDEAQGLRSAGDSERALEIYWRLAAWEELGRTLEALERPLEAANAWLRLLPFLPARLDQLTGSEIEAAGHAARLYAAAGLAREGAALHLNLGDIDAACLTLDEAGLDRLAETVRLRGTIPDNPWPEGRLSSRPPRAALPTDTTAESSVALVRENRIGGSAAATLDELLGVPVTDPHFVDVVDLVTQVVFQQNLMSVRVALFLEPILSGDGLDGRQPSPETLYRMGRLYERIGLLSKAHLAYAQALALEPDHRATRIRLARLQDPGADPELDALADSFSLTVEADPSQAESRSLAEAVASTTQEFRIGPLGPGSVVAERFELLKPLGEGGGGVVFEARDAESDDVVALKILRAGPSEMRAVKRFQREMEICHSLEHPNIVRTRDSGGWRDLHWIAMERLDGIDLGVLVRRIGRPVPVRPAVNLLRQALSGLAYAHEREVVHRDIKPSNIFVLRGSHQLKLLDFGLAVVGDEPRLTRIGTTVGSPRYMAPERLRGAGEVGPWTDLYSIGVVTYRMLTARLPFQEKELSALLDEVQSSTPASVQELNPAVPPALGQLVDRLLAKEPEDRFRAADEVLSALGEVAELMGKSAK